MLCGASGRRRKLFKIRHIFGYLGAETNAVTNGPLLRSDLHTLYDRGLISIDPTSMAIVIVPRLQGGK
ncbi:HNH endonuclease [Herbaspirillum sp. GCM10030257]|uniref:HNH endonuclease n=1 Tax=Herbaspirillum sp. GCM10030257 TaxID=3273393 RepID=UPI0036192C7A